MTGLTPKFSIPYPDNTTRVADLGTALGQMAGGVESALIAAGIPAATNSDRIVAASVAARDEHYGVPGTLAARLSLQAAGAECTRLDSGFTERYYADYDAVTNPGGATPAGWYPVSGRQPYFFADQITGVKPAKGTFSAPRAEWGPRIIQGGMTWTGGMVGLAIPVTGIYRLKMVISSILGAALSSAKPAALLNPPTTLANTSDPGETTYSILNGEVTGSSGKRLWSTPENTVLLKAGDRVVFTMYSLGEDVLFSAEKRGNTYLTYVEAIYVAPPLPF